MPLTATISLLVLLLLCGGNAQLAGAVPHAGAVLSRRGLSTPRQHQYAMTWNIPPTAAIHVQGATRQPTSKRENISGRSHPGSSEGASQHLAPSAAAMPPVQHVRVVKNVVEAQLQLLLPSEQLTESCNQLHLARLRSPVLA